MFTSSVTQILQLEQRQLYGSSRLGVIPQEVLIAENASWPNVTPTCDTANSPFVLWNSFKQTPIKHFKVYSNFLNYW
ncbi:MAG: hypothetical protein K1X82_05115 [Bacteroidia bacterium]|nr:hypothetical protein [Bacteroidia bacterium]